MSQRCIQCGSRISGRVDKRFCSSGCRSGWHNERRKRQEAYVRRINSILKHNRKLLFDALERGQEEIDKGELIRQGFDFSFFTNRSSGDQGMEITCCYEVGFMELTEHRVRIFSCASEAVE